MRGAAAAIEAPAPGRPAAAGALVLCLACDLMRAAGGARIGQIEAQAGGIPYAGGTQRIASRVGAARAAEMVLTGAVYLPETLARGASSTGSYRPAASPARAAPSR